MEPLESRKKDNFGKFSKFPGILAGNFNKERRFPGNEYNPVALTPFDGNAYGFYFFKYQVRVLSCLFTNMQIWQPVSVLCKHKYERKESLFIGIYFVFA